MLSVFPSHTLPLECELEMDVSGPHRMDFHRIDSYLRGLDFFRQVLDDANNCVAS